MKWIEMMVKKLTARYMSLNRQFKVQRHTIVCRCTLNCLFRVMYLAVSFLTIISIHFIMYVI